MTMRLNSPPDSPPSTPQSGTTAQAVSGRVSAVVPK